MILPVKIISGRGKAKGHVESMHDEIQEKLSFTPYPGTMNLVSFKPCLLNPNSSIKLDGGKRLLWPAQINGCTVHVYRWKHAPLHVFEAISEIKLREALGVQNGEVALLKIDDFHIKRNSFISRLAWYTIWWKRCEWSYKKNGYYKLTMPYAKILGATQLMRSEYSFKLFLKESLLSPVHYLKRFMRR